MPRTFGAIQYEHVHACHGLIYFLRMHAHTLTRYWTNFWSVSAHFVKELMARQELGVAHVQRGTPPDVVQDLVQRSLAVTLSLDQTPPVSVSLWLHLELFAETGYS